MAVACVLVAVCVAFVLHRRREIRAERSRRRQVFSIQEDDPHFQTPRGSLDSGGSGGGRSDVDDAEPQDSPPPPADAADAARMTGAEAQALRPGSGRDALIAELDSELKEFDRLTQPVCTPPPAPPPSAASTSATQSARQKIQWVSATPATPPR